jgi:hypothetical protein
VWLSSSLPHPTINNTEKTATTITLKNKRAQLPTRLLRTDALILHTPLCYYEKKV